MQPMEILGRYQQGIVPGMAVALVILLAVISWLVIKLLRHNASPASLSECFREPVAETIDQALLSHQRIVLDELHLGLARQQDRMIQHSERGLEMLRNAMSRESQAHTAALHELQLRLQERAAEQRENLGERLLSLSGEIHAGHERLRSELLEQLMQTVSAHARADRALLQEGMHAVSQQLSGSVEALTRVVNERLEAITGHVNQRLDEGFRKTNETFASVMARLATIDEAQKKIDGLTSNVIGLQELLGDKRARGAFGEVQLEALVRNALPPDAYAFQHTFPNNTRVDCLLRLPDPTGDVAVDAKFPLENYHRMLTPGLGEGERRQAQAAFRIDVRRHVDAIASKYILANVTSDGAVMFVPAEAVFAEIHAYHPELVSYAQGQRIWIVSPTTLMAVLNTARAVLKDVETRKQVHVIKDALGKLAKDFGRFDERMNALVRHIEQASRDVQEVQVSSRKISAHFLRIESARLDELPEQG